MEFFVEQILELPDIMDEVVKPIESLHQTQVAQIFRIVFGFVKSALVRDLEKILNFVETAVQLIRIFLSVFWFLDVPTENAEPDLESREHLLLEQFVDEIVDRASIANAQTHEGSLATLV